MGLFDKVKKKENAEVEAQPVEQVESAQEVVVENGNQSVASEVSVDNNPFVEEATPVEDVSNNPTENVPSFDNIFNATPGDLVMPESAPDSTEQHAADSQINTLQVPEFEEENKEEAITQIVSEKVNPTETPVVENAETDNTMVTELPVEQIESSTPIVEESVSNENQSAEEVPAVEPTIEQPVQAEEQIVLNPVEESIPLLETPDLEPIPEIVDNLESLENENIELPSEAQTIEPIQSEVELAPVPENNVMEGVTPSVEENISISEEPQTDYETPTVEVIENQVPVQTEPIAEPGLTDTQPVEKAVEETVQNSGEVINSIPEEVAQEETPVVENAELQIESTNENVEIQDINSGEAFIPEEIAASQNSDIIELTPEPIVQDEAPVMELSNEPMNYENDIASLAPTEDIPEERASETQIEEVSNEDNTSEEAIDENVVQEETPVVEDIQNQEIVIPELENQNAEVEEEPSNEDYYNNVEIAPIDNESSNDSDNEVNPIIEEEATDIAIPTEETSASEEPESTSEEESESEIRPIIEEEESTLNLGEAENEEQDAETEENVVVIGEEQTDLQITSDNSEEQTFSEESVIVLANDSSEEESEQQIESTTEEDNSKEIVEEEHRNIEENIAPEFDFQAFMMPQPTEEENEPNVENPTVVEAQLDAATYISEPTPTKFCSNCGVMLTDDSSICPSCGEPID